MLRKLLLKRIIFLKFNIKLKTSNLFINNNFYIYTVDRESVRGRGGGENITN
jgi:hypothetical protein